MFINLFLVSSQVLNVLTGGKPQETFSSRCFRKRDNAMFDLFRRGINKLFFCQTDHCKNAYYFELKRVDNMKEILETHV